MCPPWEADSGRGREGSTGSNHCRALQAHDCQANFASRQLSWATCSAAILLLVGSTRFFSCRIGDELDDWHHQGDAEAAHNKRHDGWAGQQEAPPFFSICDIVESEADTGRDFVKDCKQERHQRGESARDL